MQRTQLWTDLSDEQSEKLVGGHPPGGNEFGPFGSEPVLKSGFPNANENGAAGIIQGFVRRAPTCAGHPGISH